MKKRRLVVTGLTIVGAALVLSSCGGSGGGSRLSKEQYAAKANALCAAFNKKVAATGKGKTVAEQLTQIEALLPLDRKLISDVSKLKPPASEQATADRVVKLGREQADRIDAMIAAVKAKDTAKISTLTTAGDKNQAESKALFAKLGLTECGKG